MIKAIIAAIVIIPLLGVLGYFMLNMDQQTFQSVCQKDNKRYTDLCTNVGKFAYSKQSVININEKNYGKILGVAWRKKGSIISSPNQTAKRYSENNAYYYIVGDSKNAASQFLRAVNETDPRDK